MERPTTTPSPRLDRAEKASGAPRYRRRRKSIEAGLWLLWILLAFSPSASAADVREHGAIGDGKTLDTAAINKAIDACAAAGGGQVVFPPGRYLAGTIHLKSGITLMIS